MIVVFQRSSGIANWKFCQMQYYLNYTLGHASEAVNNKAEKGTVVHKVLEVLAKCKLAIQNGENSITDDVIGELSFTEEELYKEYLLSPIEVFRINSSRINKSNYVGDHSIEVGQIHIGEEFVQYIFDKAYEYYTSNSKHTWKPVDKRDCYNYIWMVLENKQYDPRFLNIVEPEKFFSFEIQKDWASYEYELGGEKLSGFFKLMGTIDLTTTTDDGIIEVVDWKGLPVNTPIPTPQGWETMGSLKVGSIVFDENGKKTKILAKSKKTIKPCYKVSFNDTSHAVCDEDHLWKLSDGRVVNVLDLKIGDSINITKPLQLKDQVLPIDPYVLGVWLGDGRNKNGEVCGVDSFIFDEIRKRGYTLGPDISGKNSSCPSYTVYGLTTELRKLKLLHNKHIPSLYLRASYKQRLDLLRGLMDSDGNVNEVRKQAVFTNCNKRLSDDTKELLLSLGQRPYQSTIEKTGFGVETTVYPISFRPIGSLNPFLLPRKANRISPTWGDGKSNTRVISSIIYIGKEETQCISVDSPSKTFLCTENMIPTHNTGQRLDWATGEKKEYKNLLKDIQLCFYFYALHHVFNVDEMIFTIYFIRDGGPFSIPFHKDQIPDIEKMIRNNFEQIRDCKEPRLLSQNHTDFRCNKICHYYKNKFNEKDTLNMCHRTQEVVQLHGIEKATELLKSEGHAFGKYQAPGSIDV